MGVGWPNGPNLPKNRVKVDVFVLRKKKSKKTNNKYLIEQLTKKKNEKRI